MGRTIECSLRNLMGQNKDSKVTYHVLSQAKQT